MDLREGIISAARELGISPFDLATVISYETGGTFDPLKLGPTTKWGQHRGLIQFGEPQAIQHGVNWDDPLGSQLGPQGAIVSYLRGSGLQPGMNLLDLYSTINAGAPGLYNRSDTAAGGAPGTVRDKVEQQMEGHKRKAAALLGGEYTPTYTSQPRISTQGGAAPMDGQPQPAAPRGLLGLFGPREDDPRSPAERRRDILSNLAIGLSGLSMFPNTAMINALQGGIQERRETRKEALAAEKAEQQRNATAEFLRAQGRGDLADAVLAAGLAGTDALSLFYQQPKDDRTALIKNYEYAKQSGYPGSFDEFLRSGGGGGSVVNVSSGADESALQKELGKNIGTDVATSIKAGQQARRNLARYDVLEQLLQGAPQGGAGAFVQMASNFGLKLEGASDVEAAQALINQLVPEQRQPGSGPMSDADLALFKQSLPRIINTPGGNELILQTLRGIANYDMQAGQIAQRLASGEIDVPTYLREMASLENPIPPVIRQQTPMSSMTGDAAADILLGR